jgi:hypothetical protein
MKRMSLIVLVLFIIASFAACSPPGIGEINCQPSDVSSDPPFLLVKEETAVPASAPFPSHITAYHRAALSEYELTYTDALCTIRQYRDNATAETAWQFLCQQSTGTAVTIQYGQAACAFEDGGVQELHFRQGTAVVTIREDGGAAHLSTWAEAVNGRLSD